MRKNLSLAKKTQRKICLLPVQSTWTSLLEIKAANRSKRSKENFSTKIKTNQKIYWLFKEEHLRPKTSKTRALHCHLTFDPWFKEIIFLWAKIQRHFPTFFLKPPIKNQQGCRRNQKFGQKAICKNCLDRLHWNTTISKPWNLRQEMQKKCYQINSIIRE